ncbi:MAG TPA: family 16 glycoside hydrolase, partial [Planctomycetota bacterium]|nr:family 16 glycoside hydrolase [Planctomycetota bacterium]
NIDAESLALLLTRLPAARAAELLPRFEASIEKIKPARLGSQEQIDKDAALRALEKLALPEVDALARKLAQSEGDVLEAPWTLLARRPDERDYDLWLGALVSTSAPKREAAFRALSGLARTPKSAEEWRALLDPAHELGARRGHELLLTLARWSKVPAGALEQASEFETTLVAVERWYQTQFPAGPAPTDPEARPHWSEAQILAFLERAASRPGSAAHGRAVFEASCNSCHAVGKSPATDSRGFGPDLASVTERLSTADLLAAILAPSRAISDQYRAFVARTTDDRQYEGVVVRKDKAGVTLQSLGSAPIELDAEDIESLQPSPRSPMPEGLLDARTLEEVRDLFAYLKAPDTPLAANDWAPLFGPRGVTGWNGDSAVWSMRGSGVVGRSSGLSRSSYLLAPQPARDLQIEFDVFLPPGGNSGLCYRAERPEGPAASDPSGLQADLGQSYWGSLYAADGTTVAAPDPKVLEAALDRNGWNHVLVRFQGDTHAMEINGLQTYATSAPPVEGTQFGFQVHQGKPMSVRIANARWRVP